MVEARSAESIHRENARSVGLFMHWDFTSFLVLELESRSDRAIYFEIGTEEHHELSLFDHDQTTSTGDALIVF
jgi:hypothetical protein